MSHTEPSRYGGPRPESLLRRAEAQATLGVSRATLRRLVRAGHLPVVYIDRRPRFLAADVEALVARRRIRGAPDARGRMNDESAPKDAATPNVDTIAVVQDAAARIVFLREALEDGDVALAADVAADLEVDLAKAIVA